MNKQAEQMLENGVWKRSLIPCTLEDGFLKLPQVQSNMQSYAEAMNCIEEAGGSWRGGWVRGVTYPLNPKRVFSVSKEGIRCNHTAGLPLFRNVRPMFANGWFCSPG
jgi:hypothetical protein